MYFKLNLWISIVTDTNLKYIKGARRVNYNIHTLVSKRLPALVGCCGRVAKVTIVDTGFAMKRLAELQAHRALFGVAKPILTVFPVSQCAASFAGYTGRGGSVGCPWCSYYYPSR